MGYGASVACGRAHPIGRAGTSVPVRWPFVGRDAELEGFARACGTGRLGGSASSVRRGGQDPAGGGVPGDRPGARHPGRPGDGDVAGGQVPSARSPISSPAPTGGRGRRRGAVRGDGRVGARAGRIAAVRAPRRRPPAAGRDLGGAGPAPARRRRHVPARDGPVGAGRAARRAPWRSSAASASAGSISSSTPAPSSTRCWWRRSAARSYRPRCRRCGP